MKFNIDYMAAVKLDIIPQSYSWFDPESDIGDDESGVDKINSIFPFHYLMVH